MPEILHRHSIFQPVLSLYTDYAVRSTYYKLIFAVKSAVQQEYRPYEQESLKLSQLGTGECSCDVKNLQFFFGHLHTRLQWRPEITCFLFNH
jgi:hypothetical protein